MLLGHTVETHKANDLVTYKLIQNDVVGMGDRDGVFNFTIWKCTVTSSGVSRKRIVDGIRNKDAVYMIWEDVKKGEQK